MALVVTAVFLGASIHALTGFGFALIVAPVFFSLYAPTEAVTNLLILGGAISLLVLTGEVRKLAVAWGPSLRLTISLVPGLFLGGALLEALPADTLRIGVGAAIIVGAALQTSGPTTLPIGPLVGSYPVGLVSGVLTTATTVGGPVVYLWMRTLGLTPGQLRDSLAAIFFMANVIALAYMFFVIAPAKVISPSLLLASASATIGGYFLGRHLFRRLAGPAVTAFSRALCLAAGVVCILDGAL